MPGIISTGTFIRGLGNISQLERSSTPVDPLAGLMVLRAEGDTITGLADGGSVSTWLNIGTSGVTNNFVQATLLNQPAWKASDALFNNHPSVAFNALAGGMTCGLNLTNPYTIIIVAAATQVIPTNRTVNSENNNCLIAINRAADAVFNGGDVVSSTSVNSTTAHIMSLAIGAQSRCYIDGVDVTTGTGLTGPWGLLALGYTASNPEPAAANIAAIGVFLGVNDTTRQLIQSTWKTKYNTP